MGKGHPIKGNNRKGQFRALYAKGILHSSGKGKGRRTSYNKGASGSVIGGKTAHLQSGGHSAHSATRASRITAGKAIASRAFGKKEGAYGGPQTGVLANQGTHGGKPTFAALSPHLGRPVPSSYKTNKGSTNVPTLDFKQKGGRTESVQLRDGYSLGRKTYGAHQQRAEQLYHARKSLQALGKSRADASRLAPRLLAAQKVAQRQADTLPAYAKGVRKKQREEMLAKIGRTQTRQKRFYAVLSSSR